MWRIRVNEDCRGTGSCVGLAPRIFALGTDGLSHPVSDVIEPDDVVLDAAASCPMEAIEVTDLDTGQRVEP